MIYKDLEAESIGLCVSDISDKEFTRGEFEAVYRLLKPGRRFVVVCHDGLENSAGLDYLPPSSRAVSLAVLEGFRVRHHLVWNDPTAGERWLAGKTFPRGPSVVPNHTISDIWVFQKPDTWTSHSARYEPLPETELPYDVMDRRFFETYVKQGVWDMNGTRSKDEGYPDAPVSLFEPFVRMWSRPREKVLDVLPENGNVLVAAVKWRREPVWIESDPVREMALQMRVEDAIMRYGLRLGGHI